MVNGRPCLLARSDESCAATAARLLLLSLSVLRAASSEINPWRDGEGTDRVATSSVFTCNGGGFMTIYDLLEEKKNAQETVSAVALWFIYYVYSEVVPGEVHEEIVTIVTEL